ncbi:NAD-dependent epimerase/dehydratase [Mesorhizobium sp. BAC0120]|uniref:NAD-dependent epimerase/dehydratase family protein n=1 Tax=Mesorhizobium sp. BAC0120 TaxID=3090670 RepID=UPI00298BCF62|nr:NAD-dependent epimerase/dehydratase [Mesorhizobium sp. BAC0120]MDW6025915.1 NAD-dependent epimerase/dehydratase [Mesorhizobium sp. BAC0120]
MKIVITGNMGYLGPIVASHIRNAIPDAILIGVDSALFAHCIVGDILPDLSLDAQIFKDIRDIEADLFEGIDAVIHLAAISNDPMGTRFEAVTEEINQKATLRVAGLAAESHVKHFVFASSCSIYGFADQGARSEGDSLNPLTAYARSKVGAEIGLREVSARTGMTVTALRFATACGFSGRIRLDLVLNDFVASALSTGRISVLSDGTPWRPLIHVSDMARAIEWAISRPVSDDSRFLAVNVGADESNFQVAELAAAVRAAIPGTEIDINPHAAPDGRSYRVDFALYRSLAPGHQPQVSLAAAVEDVRDGLKGIGFNDPDYRASDLIRFNVLANALGKGRLLPDLRWAHDKPRRPVRLPPSLQPALSFNFDFDWVAQDVE